MVVSKFTLKKNLPVFFYLTHNQTNKRKYYWQYCICYVIILLHETKRKKGRFMHELELYTNSVNISTTKKQNERKAKFFFVEIN